MAYEIVTNGQQTDIGKICLDTEYNGTLVDPVYFINTTKYHKDGSIGVSFLINRSTYNNISINPTTPIF